MKKVSTLSTRTGKISANPTVKKTSSKTTKMTMRSKAMAKVMKTMKALQKKHPKKIVKRYHIKNTFPKVNLRKRFPLRRKNQLYQELHGAKKKKKKRKQPRSQKRKITKFWLRCLRTGKRKKKSFSIQTSNMILNLYTKARLQIRDF